MVVVRDGAGLGRETAGDGVVVLEQSSRRGEKKAGGKRGLDHSSLGAGGASWRGSKGRYELTAFLQASGGGGGRWLHRKKPGAPSASPEVRAPATGAPGTATPRPPHYPAAAPSSRTVRSPQALGGRGLRPLPLFPALPCPAPRDPARPDPAQPLSTHGSDSSGGSSPAPASPPPTPCRSSAAGSEPRGAWRVGTRGAFAPGTGT